jgi:M6 family metalloprotease-like protein
LQTRDTLEASRKKTLEIGLLVVLFMFSYCYSISVYSPVRSHYSDFSLNSTLETYSSNNQKVHLLASHLSPATETRRVIVILIELHDRSYSMTPSDINSTVFTSMASYFYNVSYGNLIISGSTTIAWNPITNNTIDYGKDTAAGIDDTDNDGVPDSWKLIRDAVSLLNSSVDFSAYDTVIVVHSGQDQAKSGAPNDIWSAYYNGLDIPANHGVIITTGIVISETDPLGIFAHEFGHALGLPDLYDENRTGADDFVGPWDLMADGAWLPSYSGTSPSEPTSWSRMKLGWLTSSSIKIGRNMSGILDPLEINAGNFTAMKIPITTQTYYMVEVRQKTGYDGSLPESGVLILYCDESLSSGNGIVKVKYSQSLSQATFTEITGNNMFVDNAHNINVTVLSVYSLSYRVSINLIRVDRIPPSIAVRNAVPLTWPSTQPALVEAVITDTGANSSSVKNASVVYSSDGGKSWSRILMNPGSADFYSATIPAQNTSLVTYYIEAYDYAGNRAIANNNQNGYTYGLSETTILLIVFIPVCLILVCSTILILRKTRRSKEEEAKVITIDPSRQDE